TLNGGTRSTAPTGLRLSGAPRAPLSVTATGPDVWDNVEIVDLVDDLIRTDGDAFELHAYYEDSNRDATIEIGLDSDANPYNGVSQRISSIPTSSLPDSYFRKLYDTAATPVPIGTNYVYAKISNGSHSRYYYAHGRLIVNPAPDPGAPTVTITSPTSAATW